LLDAAERLLVEVGYEATTMTAVAELAGTSIGALYRWFPDKPALASALLARYTREFEQHWGPVIAEARTVPTSKLAELLIEQTMDFFQQRPAYFVLRGASVKLNRDASARQNLRAAFIRAFRAKKPALSPDSALLIANVVLETVKGFLAAFTAAPSTQRMALTREFTQVLSLYLGARFDQDEQPRGQTESMS
jgi:AcrR family transcriptional regulator